MSLPTGSKELGSKIGPTNVYYLTDTNTVSSSFSISSFTPTLAKPLNNYTIKNVDPNIIKTIQQALPETINNNASLFTNFPDILTTDNDIIVGDIDTTIDITFITEGAGYLNAMGYYFYYIDSNGDPKVITNSDSNTNQNANDPYFRPTIVFPNASLSRSGGDLQSGATRTLKGNQIDGTFRNVLVGFFLISNGWRSIGNGYMSTGTGYTMHTTHTLNANYNAQYLSESNVAKSDPRRGVQSALLYYVNVSSWILAFEDISRPSGDSDFNDCILLIKKTPGPTEEDLTRYTVVTPTSPYNHPAQVDSDGMFLWLDTNKLCNNGSILYFNREIHFKPTHISYREYDIDINESPRDYVKRLIQQLNWNYTGGNNVIIDNAETDYDSNNNVLTQRFSFLPQDIINNTVNGYCKLYLLSRQFNIDNTNLINSKGETNYNILLNYQSVLVDKWYSSNNAKYIDYEKFNFTCGNIVNTNLNENCDNINFEKTTIVQLCWGDPYIQKMDGGLLKLPDIPGIYTLLTNNNILIEAETNTSPHTEQIKHMKGTTFFTRFLINVIGKAKFEINMRTFEFIMDGHVKCTLGYDKDTIETITDRSMRDAIANERNFTCLTAYIDNIKVSFINLPTSIDIQNMVLFDINTLKYYAAHNSRGGMISEETCFMRPATK
jgi:uncharacterized protein (DUF2164 family)